MQAKINNSSQLGLGYSQKLRDGKIYIFFISVIILHKAGNDLKYEHYQCRDWTLQMLLKSLVDIFLMSAILL